MADSSTLVTPTNDRMVWHGWGDPALRQGLSPRAEAFLASEIGALAPHHPPVAIDDVRVGGAVLSPAIRTALQAVVGEAHVADDRRSRIEHAGGKSYPDLFRRRQGDALAAPDAIVYPATHGEIADILALARTQDFAIVPFGGGTSVVGGVEPERGRFESLICMDLRRMDALVDLDEESLLATFQPGIRGPQAEAALRRRGYTLGHFPQSYVYATIGGYVATRSAGQASTGYGRIDQNVHAVTMATPAGTVSFGRAPASAAGPDLRHALVGSEGVLGVITEATLGVRPAPEVETHEAWAAGSFAVGMTAMRDLIQHGAAADVCRLSDEDETRVFLQQTEGVRGTLFRNYLRLRGRGDGCLVILSWDGDPADIAVRRAKATRILRDHGMLRLGARPGDAWAHGRFSGPYLRDDLMDRGVLVETLETSAVWSQIPALYAAVRDSLHASLGGRGTPPLVMCHISHLYRSGCSLYFTWIARQEVGAELAQWRSAKDAANQAIGRCGATITHHHAVGMDHRSAMTTEVGDLGVEMLRALKDVVDPTGILNPGKLIPPSEA